MLIPYAATAASLITHFVAPSNPYAAIDGSLDAPVAAAGAQHPYLLSPYVLRPPWRVAGVDYPVGPMDYFVYGWQNPLTNPPAGCTVSGNTLTVTHDSVLIVGYDFTVSGGVNLLCPHSKNLRVENCRFGGPNYLSLATAPIDFRGTGFTMRYCLIDGGYSLPGGPSPPLALVYLGNPCGQVVIQYCRFSSYGGSALLIGACSSLDFQFNLLDSANQAAGPPTAWLSWITGGDLVRNLRWQFNTAVQSTLGAAYGTKFYDDAGYALFKNISCRYNTAVAAGLPGSLIGFMLAGAYHPHGLCIVGDNYFDATGATAPYEPQSWSQPRFSISGPSYDMTNGNIVIPS